MRNNNETVANMRVTLNKFLNSPSTTMKVNLIQQTPISAANHMFNYIQEQARKGRELISQGT